MSIITNEMVWRQFAVAIDWLGDALRDCPDELWEARLWADEPDQWVAQGFSAFWYLGYHTLFWLDLYLTGAEEGFEPPAPFDLVEMEGGESLPRVYSRAELLGYLDLCRRRCQETIAALSPEGAQRRCRFPWGEMPFGELLLYSMRHVQEHAAQLHLFLGQRARPSAGAEEAFDPALAARLGADAYGMRRYVLAFLVGGPNRDQSEEEAAGLQRAHLDNIARLGREGKLVLAGPFVEGGRARGIYIFAVETVEEARALTESDPAIQAGRLAMQLHPWYGSAALGLVNGYHERIASESP